MFSGRLINEVRCMWVDKCLQLFRDVGELKIGRYDWHELGFTTSAMLART
jgi:hypothetical protein